MENFQNSISLSQLQSELQKRLSVPYRWSTRQNDDHDGLTNFIYKSFQYDEVLKMIYQLTDNKKNELFNYAINRWYNFWSAKGCEAIFCNCEGVQAAPNEKDRLKDFCIKGIPFDHKTSVFPKQYGQSYQFAREHPDDLSHWLYCQQSQEMRKHYGNRLFIVLYRHDGEHWKLKCNFSLLRSKIKDYVAHFDAQHLIQHSYIQNSTTYSDIIWVEE
ncbi:MAG TPA: hypothetical protein PKK66_00500 [Bacteroidales bacterium]|jgi:hypothetical protein|nr:hypothetical protein [Bacteroidales bacterium]HPT51691.1 hypothetical protein [Bacteroidales bacterium]